MAIPAGKRRVYLETTVVSYLVARPFRDVLMVAKQAATEQWWREHRVFYDVFVSELVLAEAQEGDPVASRRRMEFLANIPSLPVLPEARSLTKRLLKARAIPSAAEDDAAHVALATVHRIDVLLTWNCRHIANVITLPLIRQVLEQSGYRPPEISTPENLLESFGAEP